MGSPDGCLAGAVPSCGFGSTPSLTALGYKLPNEKLNIAAVGVGVRGPAILVGAAAVLLARGEWFQPMPAAAQRLRDRLWTEMKAA